MARTPRNNAKVRRLRKNVRNFAAAARRVPARGSRRPVAYLDLVDYIATRWPLSRREARIALGSGKVHVNGEVWAYPHVPKHLLESDELGRWRIMVEGHQDPRPAQSALVLG